MLKDIEKIKLISITKQISRHGAVHTQYPHRIILRLSAVMDYVVKGERVRQAILIRAPSSVRTTSVLLVR